MDKIELAKWLHDNYEDVAKQKNWNTQDNCKVEFDALPDANKQTMIEIAERLLNFDLLRLHFVRLSLPKNTEIAERSYRHDKDPNINALPISEFSFRKGAMWLQKFILGNKA